MKRIANVALAFFVILIGLQFSGGLIGVERRAPTAICWSLTPSYGDPQGGCSHAGGVMIPISR